jgi:ATP-dependent Clp protease ATP-binding subunit ClpB
MTSNIGSHIIQEKMGEMEGWNNHIVMEKAKEEVIGLLKQVVRPEFLNRVDEIVMFEPLSKENLAQIVKIQFRQIQERLKEQGIVLEATNAALLKLADEGYDPAMGARPLKRVMQKRILNELSKSILGNYITKDSVVMMEVGEDDTLKFVNIKTEEALN